MAGHCHARFARLREVFEASFRRAPHEMTTELGAAVAVYCRGEKVVDLWGGFRDESRSNLWEKDTIVCVQSVSKGVLAACAHILVDRGELDLEKPMAHYWPEFSFKEKARLPVKWALTHELGMPAWEAPEKGMGYDWGRATAALAASKPDLVPGRDRAYHPYTFGFLVGEVVRRIAGEDLNAFFEREIARRFEVDFRFGVRAGDEDRVATFARLRHGDNVAGSSQGAPRRYADVMRRGIDVLDDEEDYNSAKWRRALIPAANGHTNARALARFYWALADGQILSPKVLAAATALQWRGRDLIVPMNVAVALGFMRNCEAFPAGPNPEAFGHAGFGGAYGFADPKNEIAFGYTPNKMWLGTTLETGARCAALVNATYECLT